MAANHERARKSPRAPLRSLADVFARRNRTVEKFGNEVMDAYKRVSPSTVTIKTGQVVYNPEQGVEVQLGVGAGWVIEPGVIVTNAHVAEGALYGGRMVVETSGAMYGRKGHAVKEQIEVDESQIYLSPDHDIAFIPIDPRLPLPKLKTGEDIQLRAGKPVMAVGAPRALKDTISSNISIAHTQLRNLTVEGRTDDYVQLNGASINPGNSGGGVFDHSYKTPRVIGMITLGAEGDATTGFMLPIQVIRDEFVKYQQKKMSRRVASLPGQLVA